MPARTTRVAPAGACDAHAHVFGPFGDFPVTTTASYALPDAPAARHRDMLDCVGLDRGVLVQPAPYATDARCLVDALQRAPDRLRGIAVATPDISDDEMVAMDAAGIRGLRFVNMRDPTGNPYAGSVGSDALAVLAPRMKALGWHAQLWSPGSLYPELLPILVAHGIPIVLDHMACLEPAAGPAGTAWAAVLRHVADGTVWVKLSLCRVSLTHPEYDDVRPLHQALVATNPDRVLWGSDWPFVRMGERSPDVGALLDRFLNWTGDDALRRRILVDNPASLYRF